MATFTVGQAVTWNNPYFGKQTGVVRRIHMVRANDGSEVASYVVENDKFVSDRFDYELTPVVAPSFRRTARVQLHAGDYLIVVQRIAADGTGTYHSYRDYSVSSKRRIQRLCQSYGTLDGKYRHVSDYTIAASPAPKFQLGQAVRGAFWSKSAGRVVSISRNDGYFYEVQLPNGRIVLEPEAYLTAAPELDATLPQMTTRRPLTTREIEISMDTPDYDAGNSSDHCQWNGLDQLNPDAR